LLTLVEKLKLKFLKFGPSWLTLRRCKLSVNFRACAILDNIVQYCTRAEKKFVGILMASSKSLVLLEIFSRASCQISATARHRSNHLTFQPDTSRLPKPCPYSRPTSTRDLSPSTNNITGNPWVFLRVPDQCTMVACRWSSHCTPCL
jgi:hypothetical protein